MKKNFILILHLTLFSISSLFAQEFTQEQQAKVLSYFENGGGVWNTTMKDGSVVNVSGNVLSVLSITRTTVEGVIV